MKILIIKITHRRGDKTREWTSCRRSWWKHENEKQDTINVLCPRQNLGELPTQRTGRKQCGWNEEMWNKLLSLLCVHVISHLGTGSVENGQEKRENERWQFDSNKISFYCSSPTLRIWFLFICDAVVWLGGSSYTHESSLHEQHVSPSPTLHSWPLPSLVLLAVVVVVRWCRFDFDFVLPPLPAESIASSVIVSSHE